MRKIVVIIDALNFREELLDVYQHVAETVNGRLTIIFLDDENGSSLMVPDLTEGIPAHKFEIVLKAAREKERIINEHTTLLKQEGTNRHILFNFHKNKGIPVEEAIIESRFADLVLISKDISFSMLYDSNPSGFLKNILTDAQCPVLVLPDTTTDFREVILAYNGTYSSMVAIRQFVNLFATSIRMKVTVIYVAENNVNAIPHQQQLKEYLDAYYENVEYRILLGEPDEVFMNLLNNRQDCMIAFGAYGRSRFSRFFKRSSADNILRKINVPVFITHS
jgi:nucleotide-binding universal stress UspA family protein